MSARILVIDDDQDVVRFLTANLELEGYAVKGVLTAAEGLAAALEDPPDLVLLDVLVSGGGGGAVLERVRTSPGTSNVPILVMSAQALSRDVIAGLDAGADDFVAKPFDIAVLMSRVRAVLRRSRAMRDLSPLTGLPGNFRIAEELERRINAGGQVAVVYGDLDHFKAFNDHYGFMRGDTVIKFAAHTLLEAAAAVGDPTSFIGHVGGDDFIMVMDPEYAEAFCQQVVDRFDDGILDFYDRQDAMRGYVEVIDRRGERHKFPVVSVSLGVATNRRRSFTTEWEASAVASEMKEHAKSEPGSAYKIDRRSA